MLVYIIIDYYEQKTPGPGMYEKTQIASSLPPSLTQAGRQYGIFYSGVFQA